jgi:hypothetical protein
LEAATVAAVTGNSDGDGDGDGDNNSNETTIN